MVLSGFAGNQIEREQVAVKKDQRGFTFVELMIAITLMTIVTASVCGFIVVGSRNYTLANADIMLQQEAQLACNQITDMMIGTTGSIIYGDGVQMVLRDSEFDSEPAVKSLVVINHKEGDNDNPSYRFEWNKAEEVIYLSTSDTVIDETHPEPVFDEAGKAVLAEHVKEFHVDISHFEENRIVRMSLTFAYGGREYTTFNNVTVRNRIALNKITAEPMKKADEEE